MVSWHNFDFECNLFMAVLADIREISAEECVTTNNLASFKSTKLDLDRLYKLHFLPIGKVSSHSLLFDVFGFTKGLMAMAGESAFVEDEQVHFLLHINCLQQFSEQVSKPLIYILVKSSNSLDVWCDLFKHILGTNIMMIGI